jgi:GT2 family glycosyltransferase
MTNIKLSIIIPTWNTSSVTKKCIDTINQYLPEHYFEIIVIDNHSEDDTITNISKLPHVKLIKNQNNLGFSIANNQGAKIAKGNYLLFLNSDMELIDDSMLNLVHFFQKHPEIGAIGPKFLNPDKSTQASVFPPQTLTNAIKEFWLGKEYSYTKYVPSGSHPSAVNSISGGALFMRKKYFDKLHGWDEKYHFYFEDMDLCRKINNDGKLVYYYPKCRVIHHHGASGRTIADTSNQWRRLIPSSIIYHGKLKHYIINFVLWSGQKYSKFKTKFFR